MLMMPLLLLICLSLGFRLPAQITLLLQRHYLFSNYEYVFWPTIVIKPAPTCWSYWQYQLYVEVKDGELPVPLI